jgi:hypothetical protein
MTTSFEFEKREYIRLPIAVPVRYKFLSREISGPQLDEIHEGISQNIGAGGLLLRAKLPEAAWLSPLLTRKMFVGINMILPNGPNPIKALCRVIWSSAVQGEGNQFVMGLEFQEITQGDRDLITQYIIKAQMPH